MEKILFWLLAIFLSVTVSAQDYEISFTPTGEANSIDSILVQNISQSTSIVVNGDDVLNLVGTLTGIASVKEYNNINIYPNPSYDYAMLEILQNHSSNTIIYIFDISGKLVLSQKQFLNRGFYTLRISGFKAGLYYVKVLSEDFEAVEKLVSTGEGDNKPLLVNLGYTEISSDEIFAEKIKTSKNLVEMQYNDGEVIVITAYSRELSVRDAFVPVNNQTLSLNFVTCMDPDGIHYTTISIGEQVWMAENLKYLPQVNDLSVGSSLNPHYYVYDYNGQSVTEGKQSENYQLFGVLYDFSAASISCPFGWKLPTHDDWTILEREICSNELCESSFPFDTITVGATGISEGSVLSGYADIWQDGSLDNNSDFWTSGFGIVPGGLKTNYDVFNELGNSAYFYSSTPKYNGKRWTRSVNNNETQIYRLNQIDNESGLSVRCILTYESALSYSNTNTVSIDNISTNSVLLTGEVTFQGSSPIVSKGFVWSTSPDPTLDAKSGYTDEGGGMGIFQSIIDGLYPDTLYYVRAYSTNSVGISYGEELSFRTLSAPNCGDVIYDLVTYKTVQINNQCWFAENLKYLPQVFPPESESDTEPMYYVNGYYGSNVEIAKTYPAYNVYGVLYNWTAAMNNQTGDGVIQGACPTGWQLPSDDDWKELELSLGMSPSHVDLFGLRGINEGSKIAGSADLWQDGNLKVSNSFGISFFNALPAGSINVIFTGVGENTYFWSSTHYINTSALARKIEYQFQNIDRTGHQNENVASIRCLRSVNEEAYLPFVITSSANSVLTTSAQIGGNVVNDGGSVVTSRGVVISEIPHPTVDNNQGILFFGVGVGEFICQLAGINPATTYYYRAFAENENGIGYGFENSFTTEVMTLPDVVTLPVENIEEYSAKIIGEVSDDGGADVFEYGILWSYNEFLTIDDNLGMIALGNGEGQFNTTLINLEPETLYYVRAYATNVLGVAYGDVLNFETSNQITPDLSTDGVGYVSCDSVVAYGNVLNDFGFEVLDKGFVWSNSGIPTLENNIGYISCESGTGLFSISITNLLPSTNYVIRTYGTNVNGSSYGNVFSFETSGLSTATLITSEISDITDSSANVLVDVLFDGCSELSNKGIVWSTQQNPDLVNNDGLFSSDSTTNSFLCNINGTEDETEYFVRAFAVNEAGVSFGNQLSFITPNQNPHGLPCEDMDSVLYEGYWYKTVHYGGLCWFAENLRYMPAVFPSDTSSVALPRYYVMGYNTSDLVEASESFSYLNFGTLYNWDAAKTACPDGWHLPSDSEWKQLESAIGMPSDTTDLIGWRGDSIGSLMAFDSDFWSNGILEQHSSFGQTAFKALPGGYRYDPGNFSSYYRFGGWWTSTPDENNGIWKREITYNKTNVNRSTAVRNNAYSVRCVHGSEFPNIGSVVTSTASEILATSCVSGGQVYDDGGLPILSRGVVWGLNPHPSLSNCEGYSTDGSGLGEFTSNVSGLMPGTYYYICAYATNDLGTAYGSDKVILTPDSLPHINTIQVSNIVQTSASVLVEFVFTGGTDIDAIGVVLGLQSGATVAVNDGITQENIELGMFTSYLTNLSFNSEYYVRAYAVSEMGTVYGDELAFTTLAQADLPIVETGVVTDTTAISAVCSGNLIDDGGELATIKGVVWSVEPMPTFDSEDNFVIVELGLGEFEAQLSDLEPNTTYYARAFASNTGGIAYGEELSFITDTIDVFENCGDSLFYQLDYYQTKQFGDRCWLTENLRYLPYIDLENISDYTIPHYFVYGYDGNDVAEAKASEPYGKYGVLYNFIAAESVCPPYWHLPSFEEWMLLCEDVCTSTTCETDFPEIADDGVFGTNEGAILSGEYEYWNSGALNTNPEFGLSGFNALPGGIRNYSGFNEIGYSSYFWINQDFVGGSIIYHYYFYLRSISIKANVENYGTDQSCMSVRCVKNVLPTVLTGQLSEISQTFYTISGYVDHSGADNVYDRGFVYGLAPDPTITSNAGLEHLGIGEGNFETDLVNLTPGLVYYVRAFATNSFGTSYGETLMFNTYSLPQVVTSVVDDVVQTFALTGGELIDNGGDAATIRGVVINTDGLPTVSNNIFYLTNGSAIGTYVIYAQQLTPATEYFVRAFATNSRGTVYGDEIAFTTLPSPISCPEAPTLLYEGYEYSTVKIGDQCWMAENLRYLPSVNFQNTLSYENPLYYVYSYNGTSVADATAVATGFSINYYYITGVLYNWTAAQSACPPGWHLPNESDWNTLLTNISLNPDFVCDGQNDNVAKSLASSSQWNTSGTQCSIGSNLNLNNSSGFKALGGGLIRSSGGDYDYKKECNFWSSTSSNVEYGLSIYLYYSSSVVEQISQDKKAGLSIRCIKD